MILFEKFGQHQPLNRQSERYAREGVELSLSTLADQVGACATALRPLFALVEAHVLAADRLHGDDTTVPILAKGQTETGRVWVYVRDDRPFGGKDPPAALFYASRDRTREHPERHLTGWAGILQADAFDGYNRLYLPNRKPSPIVEALCWSHARRKFFELADIAANARRGKNATPLSPIAFEVVKRIDALFAIERQINGLSPARRLAERQERSGPLVASFEGWIRAERAKLSRPALHLARMSGSSRSAHTAHAVSTHIRSPGFLPGKPLSLLLKARLEETRPYYMTAGLPAIRSLGSSPSHPAKLIRPRGLLLFRGKPGHAAFRTAPSGTMPSRQKRHSAINSLRASATIMVFRIRPFLPVTRATNHWLSCDAGCHLVHSQANSISAARNLALPAFDIPCSRSIVPLRQGVGASPA
jgi:hypothetical protein